MHDHHKVLPGTGDNSATLALAETRICALTRFEASVLPRFGLPDSLPD